MQAESGSRQSTPDKIKPMKQETLQFLLNLNRDFYDAYAQSFSSTRYTIQPGIRQLLPQLLKAENLLDLGCGNGNLAQALIKAGFTGTYLGVDNSLSLIQDAKKAIPENKAYQFSFRQVDLSAQLENLSDQSDFDAVTCFAVIHHFPADPYLNMFFEFARKSLAIGGTFYLSTWQVKNNKRLSARIQPWSLIEVDSRDLNEDDLLLDWRADPTQPPHYRYVRHYDSVALTAAGLSSGLVLENEFFSDGKEGDLALYQVWNKPKA